MVSEIDNYLYGVTWSEEDGEFVGLCAEFPSLSWLDGNPEAALRGIRSVVSDCVLDMAGNDEAPPAPMASGRYSDEFLARVPPEIRHHLCQGSGEGRRGP
uniref:HicB family protein n=1 Tax=Candidatus Kentrum sp. DK TaxID=2126562 RepID=A0A450TQS6_9GAMM|nr:MAG: hypothetical protein BECKDK2373C_GA0170839_12621 [Candidatus Kentron sp. DK]